MIVKRLEGVWRVWGGLRREEARYLLFGWLYTRLISSEIGALLGLDIVESRDFYCRNSGITACLQTDAFGLTI